MSADGLGRVVDRSKLAIGYTRISKLEVQSAAESLSLEGQREKIEAYCKLKGLRLLLVFEDTNTSGATRLRERLRGAELMRQLEHPDARGTHVVAAKLDRLFRDAADALTVTQRWAQIPVHAHLLDLPAPDLSSPEGRLILGLFSLFAEWELNKIRDRTRMGLETLRRKGKRNSGHAPWGYRFEGDDVVPVPKELAALGRMYYLRTQGYSEGMIRARMDGEGWPTRGQVNGWTRSNVHRMLVRLEERPYLALEATRVLRALYPELSDQPPKSEPGATPEPKEPPA